MKKKDALDPESPHWINPFDGILFSTKPIAVAEIPKFVYQQREVAKLFGESAGDVTLLLLLNLAFFAGVVMAFNRYDVR